MTRKGMGLLELIRTAVLGWEEWKNPQATVPLGNGPIQVDYLDQSFSGRLLNEFLKFRCNGGVVELPCSKIRLIKTTRQLFRGRRSRIEAVIFFCQKLLQFGNACPFDCFPGDG